MAISGPGRGISLLTFPQGFAVGQVLSVTSLSPYTLEWVTGGGGGGGNVLTLTLEPANVLRLTQSVGISPIDVDLSTIAGGGVFGSEQQTAQVLLPQVTTLQPSAPNDILGGTFPAIHNSLVIPAVPLGNYWLQWVYAWNHDAAGNDFLARLSVPSQGFIGFHRQEPKDAAGGVQPDAPPGSGTNQRYWAHGGQMLNNYVGGETIDLEFATSNAGVESTIIQSTLLFWRIS